MCVCVSVCVSHMHACMRLHTRDYTPTHTQNLTYTGVYACTGLPVVSLATCTSDVRANGGRYVDAWSACMRERERARARARETDRSEREREGESLCVYYVCVCITLCMVCACIICNAICTLFPGALHL